MLLKKFKSALKKLSEETDGRFHCFSNSQEVNINPHLFQIVLKKNIV